MLSNSKLGVVEPIGNHLPGGFFDMVVAGHEELADRPFSGGGFNDGECGALRFEDAVDVAFS